MSEPSTQPRLAPKLPAFARFSRPAWLDRGALILLVLFLPLLLASNARIAATDEAQYYVYLTSLRFDGDFNFANDYQRLAELNPKSGIDNLLSESRIRPKTGLYGNIAPVGSAILWSPFFFATDGVIQLANTLGAHINVDHGFARPYIRAVCYASAIYGLIGLLICYRLARRYTSQFASGLATITIWLATPLVFYMFVQMGFSHANGFFLVALFLYIWQTTRPTIEQPRRSWKAWLALGLLGGLMAITREQLGLFLLLPAIEAIRDYWSVVFSKVEQGQTLSFSRRLNDFGSLFVRHAAFLLVFLISLTPQIVTYQVLNGDPRPASEVGGKFVACSPHLIDTLIDYNPAPSPWCNIPDDPSVNFPPFAHGAFIWNPVLPFALLGLLLLWRRDRFLAVMLAVAFFAQTYVNGAFGTTWHLTGSFGFRRLIECTPIFIIGLALGIEWLAQWIDRRLIAGVATALIAWNLGLIVNWTLFNDVTQLRKGMTWPDLFRWQLETPMRLAGKIQALLFDRCKLMDNGC